MGKGDTLEKIAKIHKKSYPKLMEYNDMRHDTPVGEGSIIFLSFKKTKGLDEFYIIKSGDTMYSISQNEGMTLESLYEKNRLKVGAVPPVGTKLYLHKKIPKKYAKNEYNVQ
ncbi:MAG: LysM peptidoglycan-binding domain-containing protein [Flavobacteriales bacterium]|nr:LysM peptidoglycan-binding domain-containing protein [Flavobacteriales bacterium]